MAPPEVALPAQVRGVLADWNRRHPAELQVHDRDLLWNLTAQDLVSYRAARIDQTDVIYGLATGAGLEAGLSPRSLWVALWSEVAPGKEREWLAGLQAFAKSQGKTRLSIGADEFHFVPGLPLLTEEGQNLAVSAESMGFQGSQETDFVGSLQTEPVRRYIESALAIADERGLELVPVETEPQIEDLKMFLQREFPGRWSREFIFQHRRKDTACATWARLWQKESGTIGFARWALRGPSAGVGETWYPGALRLPLIAPRNAPLNAPKSGFAESAMREASDCCLGPIGVALSARGQGTGRALLGLVLRQLSRRGGKQLCIDWTDAIQYYAPLGLARVREFRTAWKSLD